jgi:hypothetical protein
MAATDYIVMTDQGEDCLVLGHIEPEAEERFIAEGKLDWLEYMKVWVFRHALGVSDTHTRNCIFSPSRGDVISIDEMTCFSSPWRPKRASKRVAALMLKGLDALNEYVEA